MDKSRIEECEEDTEESCVPEGVSSGTTSRRQRAISCLATGVYIDLLRRVTEQARVEEQPGHAPGQSTLATSTAETVRIPITPVSESLESSETDTELISITEIQPSLDESSLLQELRPEVNTESQNLNTVNEPSTVEGSAPPSYTSLPPPLPVIGLPSTVPHSAPPPSYEQTYGLRYLDRDQPVLVFNTQDMWGYRPQLAYCLSCNAMVLTSVRSEYCQVTHLAALLSFIFCCWPCCVLPYFIPALKEAHHHCPACNGYLGTYQPFSRHG